ncbi:MAG: hypothetical protein ACI83O_000733 [Patescibacteria group bacterium]|jgi:hypothetical protein
MTLLSMKKIHPLLISASKQALIEALGYEEGMMYYLLLTKDDLGISAEFSYSKRYRIFKRLFALGAMIKVKLQKTDNFVYSLLPALFLNSKRISSEVVDYLDKLYLEFHFDGLRSGLVKVIAVNEQIVIHTLLRYSMRNDAKLVIDDSLSLICSNMAGKVHVVRRKGLSRSYGVIDASIVFDFARSRFSDEEECYGYINHTGSRSEVRQIEEEILA